MASQSAHEPTKWVGVSPRGRTLEIISPLFFSLSFVAVALRLYARLTTIRTLLADDYICILAQIFGFGLMAVIVILVESCGIGWNIEDLPPGQLVEFFKVYTAGELLYTATVASYKLAVVFLYRSIFGEVKMFNITSWVIIGVTISWFIAGVFATIFQCSPVQTTWDPLVPGVCFDQDAYVLAFSLINMALDVVILIMPLPMIWRLNLTTKKKIALSSMFLLGIIVVVMSILRITSSFPVDFVNPTYSLFEVTMWSQIEPAIGIIAACLPTLRQFFFRSLPGRSKASQERKYASKSDLDSTSKSHTAVALTGWKSNEAYVEVGSAIAMPRGGSLPDIEANSFLEDDSTSNFLDVLRDGPTGRSEEVDSRSILVKKKVSVTRE